MVRYRPRERGATLLMVTFICTMLLIPIIGTCIDGAVLYWVKARLSAAVDATALATGRSLNVGTTSSQQMANAIAMGQMYFSANFPAGLMRTAVVGGAPTITITNSGVHQRIVNVSASVTVPLYFMPIIGYKNQTVAATGQATRRDANVMLVLDRSNSMNNASGSCSALVASAQNFVNQFVDGRDQLGLVTFQTGANVDYAPTLYFKSSNPSLSQTLSTLVCAGDTSTAQGLYLGYNQIQTVINQPGALNVIVLFTDGQPNAIVANFPIKTQSDNRYDPVNTSSLTPMGPSNCWSTDQLIGVIADASTETATGINDLNPTGYTAMVLSSAGVPIYNNSNPTTINAPGCAFPNSNWNYSVYGREDVAYIPTQDYYGNSIANRNMVPNLDTFTSGNYNGFIRPDMPRTVRWAAFNAADSMAQTIHKDSVYSPIIYTIGLSGNESMAMDQDFMQRLANDPNASNFNSSLPQGQFIMANNNSQLSQAFQQVASQILRLSR